MIQNSVEQKEKRALQIYAEVNGGMRNPSQMDRHVFIEFMKDKMSEQEMRGIFEKTALFNNVFKK